MNPSVYEALLMKLSLSEVLAFAVRSSEVDMYTVIVTTTRDALTVFPGNANTVPA